ncbi:ferritin-like domain-containing protein [Nocardioides massiliensis]|uniref:DUF4439 domain-containing protein n=1 Tax=Nocardioides massiliensis TaxID=1325935 RepID=A0ABT9NQS6_9ACTN|nr:ferritin-like domain-containing protein [Nocardioides massiliensis]MDP9822617.1 hypothetical protein [Nocardioides massiliensis]
MSTSLTPVDALQDALAAEHAAVHLLGFLGARTSTAAQPQLAGLLRAGYVLHRGRRDQLVRMLRDRGAEPVAAFPTYDDPRELTSAAGLRGRARQLEEDCCAVYATAAGATWGAARQWALQALLESAGRAIALGAEPATWPGLPERVG